MKKKQLTGLKYGYLTAQHYVRTDPKDGAAIWTWRCDCGNLKELKAKVVTAGRSRTCGKCHLKHKLKASSLRGSITENRRLLGDYKKAQKVAERRRLKWALSIEDYSHLSQNPCTLCGTLPDPRSRNKIEPLDPQCNGPGYTVDSTYIRCKECELIYSKVSLSQIIASILAVHSNLTREK